MTGSKSRKTSPSAAPLRVRSEVACQALINRTVTLPLKGRPGARFYSAESSVRSLVRRVLSSPAPLLFLDRNSFYVINHLRTFATSTRSHARRGEASMVFRELNRGKCKTYLL